jgi:RNA recognition motif-containing protein
MAKKLYVGNIAWGLSDEELKEAFAPFGEIEDLVIITDRATGRSKGFGFVTFTNDDDADRAIDEMSGKEIDGRPLTVNEARPKEEGAGRDRRF